MLHHYPDTESFYIEFKPAPGTETSGAVGGLNVDLDIGHASKLLDFSTLKAVSRTDQP